MSSTTASATPVEKPHVSFVLLGHCDSGKSTIAGHLLHRLGAVHQTQVDAVAREAAERGRPSMRYGFLMDTLREERERCLSMNFTVRFAETPKARLTVVDAPGHSNFMKAATRATCLADSAVLVVSARYREAEAGNAMLHGMTRKHAALAHALGAKRLVVLVNKMDDAQAAQFPEQYCQNRFKAVQNLTTEMLQKTGFPAAAETVTFIPVSGLDGANLVGRSEKLSWYDGPTVLEALLALPPASASGLDYKPLRLPIQRVFRNVRGVGTVVCGRVEAGTVKAGDTIVVAPSGVAVEVKSVFIQHEAVRRAMPGDVVGLHITATDAAKLQQVRSGAICGDPKNDPAKAAASFVAQIHVIHHPRVFGVGYEPVIAMRSGACVPVRFDELIAKVDRRTGRELAKNPIGLKSGEAAVVKLVPKLPLCLDAYAEVPQLGRFELRDSHRTIAVGVVKSVERREGRV